MMTRFWKPRNLPAVVWNPKKSAPFFEFTPEGFCDTDDPQLIAYMVKCGYVKLTAKQVADSDVFIAEQMKKRGQDQSGFVQQVPAPDQSETNPDNFQPVVGGEGQAADAPHPIPEVVPVQGAKAESAVPAFDEDEDDVEDVDDDAADVAEESDEVPAAKPAAKKKVAKKKTVTRRKKKE